MLLRQFALALLIFVSVEADLNCPDEYKYDTNYGCISLQYAAERDSAYRYCAGMSASLFRIRNAYDNSAFGQICIYGQRCWLGITCNSGDVSSCIFDNGDPVIYNNFAPGEPKAVKGPCVYYDKTTGFWYTGDCFTRNNFVCQIDENIDPQYCGDFNTFYRGKCYFYNITQSLADAESNCQAGCGQLVSIHTQQQNQLFQQYVAAEQFCGHPYNFSYLGLQSSGKGYSWLDNSAYDYNNFGVDNPSLGSCVLMSVSNSVKTHNASAGQWFNSACSMPTSRSTYIGAVCVKDPVNNCTDPLLKPITPILCDSKPPLYSNDSGTIYSPGYPRGSLYGLVCEYDIVIQSGGKVSATIDYDIWTGHLEFYDSLDSEASTFEKITGSSTRTINSTTNTMKIVYTVGSDDNLFVLNYVRQ